MKPLRTTVFIFFVFLTLLARTLSAETLATVDGQAITMHDFRQYARASAILFGQLSIPGGPMQVLDIMLQERLLQLEGKRRGIEADDEAAEKDPRLYARQVYNALLPPCPEPDAQAARAFYDAHPERFSTPLFLRLERIGLRSDADSRAANTARLEQLKQRILQGEIDFASAEKQYNEDAESRERAGDIGYVAVRDPDAPFWRPLVKAAINDIVGPLQEKDMVFLYRVTHRREPILEPYDTAKEKAAKAQRSACESAAANALFAELSRRWPVEIKVDDISLFPKQE